CEKIKNLEFYNECIEILKKKLETLKQEKDGVDRKPAGDDQNRNSSASENGESTDSILSKSTVKFVKAAERSTTNKVETVKKPSVRYAKLYIKPSKKYTVRGNQQS
nr:hypothetical protein [Tanacetum cinerariifolium]